MPTSVRQASIRPHIFRDPTVFRHKATLHMSLKDLPGLETYEAQAALAALLRRRPIVVFDLDGILALLSTQPMSGLPDALSESLELLANYLPTAIVTGRAVADLRTRIGFQPLVIQNHRDIDDGVEATDANGRGASLEGLRAVLRRNVELLVAVGIRVEDQGPCIALHLALAPEPSKAAAVITSLLKRLEPSTYRVTQGEAAIHVTSLVDHGQVATVRSLAALCEADAVLFIGDTVDDEIVFAQAPNHWVTIRVGRDSGPSRAQFQSVDVNGHQMVVDRLLKLLCAPARS